MVDGKEYKIDIDPRILELLGPSLYTNIYYVLAELIANAYDANAKNVYIIASEQQIIVEDDGHGMSYKDGDIAKFLNVAKETRTSESEAYVKGSNRSRRKMGRKGVGKLAALSVSKDVEIKTIRDGEKSGFYLSRVIGEDKTLRPIDDQDINFYKIEGNGTSIVMKDPQYRLHKTFPAIRKNLLKMFPLVGSDFRIHISNGNKHQIIDSFEKELVEQLGCLITYGSEFSWLHKYFDSKLDISEDQESQLHILMSEKKSKALQLTDRYGEITDKSVVIKGWIGIYRTTAGRKKTNDDFPDNFLSIVSNLKLGEFNILPMVGKNSLYEVYVVGQLHIDAFEDSDLPDMALSNRQGYKSDDPRYVEAIRIIKNEMLPSAISLRAKYNGFKNQNEQKAKYSRSLKREKDLREQINLFKDNATRDLIELISRETPTLPGEQYEKEVRAAINNRLPDMGLKKSIEENKKKLLVSHNKSDKLICDFLVDLLVFCGVDEKSIIYTSYDEDVMRVPEGIKIYDYLREFFVESYSSEKMSVLYVVSENMNTSWSAISEVGAGWVVQSNHKVVSVNNFKPSEPLDISVEWSSLNFNESDNSIEMTRRAIDELAIKMASLCKSVGHEAKPKEDLKKYIEPKVIISD